MKLWQKVVLALLTAVILLSLCKITFGQEVRKHVMTYTPEPNKTVVVGSFTPPPPEHYVPSQKRLHQLWNYINETYFDNQLPKDPVLDWNEHDPQRMASSKFDEKGVFHVHYNLDYARAEVVLEELNAHEGCHAMAEIDNSDHGRKWAACMVGAEMNDLFHDIFITNYRDDD